MTELFNMCHEKVICYNNRISMYFEFLDPNMTATRYIIDVPVVSSSDFTYNEGQPINVNVDSGWYQT